MFSSIIAILFILKLKFNRNENLHDYIRSKYDVATLRTLRRLEDLQRKHLKAQLDQDFLLLCKYNNIFPNFIKFKLYRKSLYNADFYHESLVKLLDIEINHKGKRTKTLNNDRASIDNDIKSILSYIDYNHTKCKLLKKLDIYKTKVERTHNSKLRKLGLDQPKFLTPDDVIFNYSNHILTDKEKHLLTLGLDFKLPIFKPNFVQLFLPFEKFARSIQYSNSDKSIFPIFRKCLQGLIYKTFTASHTETWFPFFKKEDLNILKSLGKNKDIVICRPDKGKGVVILNKNDYISKLNSILNDNTKFSKITELKSKVAFRIEDKLNRFLNKLKNDSIIDQDIYSKLHSTGSSFGIMYGCPKVHKNNVPLRPILAAYNLPNFNLAKYLVPILHPLTQNEYVINNSFEFASDLQSIDPRSFLVSFDVESLFTNIPLDETIDIILNELFPTPNTYFNGCDKNTFKRLLQLSVCDTHFVFNEDLYKQIDGVSMGSPLGPTLAGIFMSNLESKYLSNCPTNFKPKFYKRYVDDTFAAFNNEAEAHNFLNFINNQHPNIKFTIETEESSKLPFLDILITKEDNKIKTSVYRKKTFTGLGTNFYSFTYFKYKLNSLQTVMHRAYKVCSDWVTYTKEMDFLTTYFSNNSYPIKLINNAINKYINNKFQPKLSVANVPKKVLYVPMPFLGFKQNLFNCELKKIVAKFYPFIDLKIAPTNPISISTFFKFKDSMPIDMRSGVVYSFNCPECTSGTCTYIGCTDRMLRVRVAEHRGRSYRTDSVLKNKEDSAIRKHCKRDFHLKNFKILGTYNDTFSLHIAESLYIKQHCPNLNKDTRSVPLYIA
jgi:hypothetical protein